MAVAANQHGKAIGAKFVAYVMHTCKKDKFDVLWCNAREKVTRFYQKQGFQTKGNPFHIKNVGTHYVMRINL